MNQAKRQKDADDIYSLFVMGLKDKLANEECPSQVLKLALEFLKQYYVDQPSTDIKEHLEEAIKFPYKKVQ